MMEDSQPHHLQNVTIYAADTVSQGVLSVVKQEEETFDGVGGGASGVGVARANGTLRVNETLVPCPGKGGGVVKEEELLDDLFGSADPEPVLQHGAPGPSSKSLFNPESIVPSSTQRSVNMAADVSFTDSSVGSVLASNSVTPTSLGSSGGGSVMSALFGGKRKASDGGVGESRSKRPCSGGEEAGGSSGSKQSTPAEEAVVKAPPPALKDTPTIASIVSKKADLTTNDVVTRRTVPPQPSGLLFSQHADGLGTRKRTRGQLRREESPDVGESPDLESEVKRHCVTSDHTHQATVAIKEDSHPSVIDGEEDQVTPKETRHVPKMAASCEREYPPQSQRTMEPSGVEGKASTTAAAVTTRSAAKSVAPGGLVTSPPVTMATCAIPVTTATAAMPVIPVTMATPATTFIPVTTATPSTPVRLITMPTASSPFLSTRKHKAAAVVEGTSLGTQGRSEDGRAKTQDSSRGLSMVAGSSHPSVSGVRAAVCVSPFNLFSGMGGKRSKVTETDLWKEGEEEEEGPEAEPWDGEDPLESGVKYDPVMTKDGFICPREQPKKIVSLRDV